MNSRSSRPTPVRARVREAVAVAILDAAEAVALERGLEGASAAAIARRAGVAVGTLYNYFPDRAGIFAALFAARRAAMAPRLAAAAAAAAELPFAARVRAFAAALMTVFDEQRGFIRLLLATDPVAVSAKTRTVGLVPQLEQHFEDIMRAGAAKKLFPAAEVALQARMLLGALRGVAVWRVSTDAPMAGDAARVCDAWLRGVERR